MSSRAETDRAPLARRRRQLERRRSRARERFFESADSLGTLRALSAAADRTVTALLPETPSGPGFSVFALGGYGRRELFPASDVDLLILDHSPPEQPAASAVQQFLQELWDLDFRVGQQVWRWGELEQLGEDDLQFLLALCDVRPLAAEPEQDRRLRREFLPAALERYGASLGEFLLEWTRQRHARFSDTIHQLEPDLKEAPGGLRDYQVGRWAGRLTGREAFLPYSERELRGAFAFVTGLRVHLHYHLGRDRNHLTHALQEKLAPEFGYRGGSRRSSVESLMKDYFLRARMLAHYCRKGLRTLSGPVQPVLRLEDAGPIESLQQVLELFDRCVEEGLEPDEALRARILERLGQLSGHLAYSKLAGPVLRLFRPRPGLYAALTELYRLGVLELLLPEFGTIRCRVIRDFYHRYTVDEHSLLAVKAVEELAGGGDADPRFRSLLEEVEQPELLTLTLLLHDVGKSRGGKHVDAGARMAVKALRRFRLHQEFVDSVAFLIRHHLAMSAVMSRRNIEDRAEVGRFADLVGSPSMLRLLTLLTYADIKAVAPGTLNQWRRDRLWQLFVATYNHLTVGFGEERVSSENLSEKLFDNLPSEVDFQALQEFLQGFPRRYLNTTPADEIYEHFRLGRALSPRDPVQLKLERRDSHWELCVVTADRTGMFARIAGLLAAFGMNILRGYAFSNRRDVVLDFFQFDDTRGTFRAAAEQDRFRELLAGTVEGEVEVDELLARREGSLLFQTPGEKLEPVVYFDSGEGREYTIMEIVASDSLGLLYRISREITAAGCNIELVLISTEGARAVDVFYLTRGGGRLEGDLRARLKRNIEDALA